MIDYTKLRLSLQRLRQQHENYQSGNPALTDLDREGIAESVRGVAKTVGRPVLRITRV